MTWFAVGLGLAGLILGIIAIMQARQANRAAHDTRANVNAAVQAAFSAAADAQKSHQELVARSRAAVLHDTQDNGPAFPGPQERGRFNWVMEISRDEKGLVTSLRAVSEGSHIAHDVTFIVNSDEHAERSVHFDVIRPGRPVDLRAEQTVAMHRDRVAEATKQQAANTAGIATDMPRKLGPIDTHLRLSIIAVTEDGTPQAYVIERTLRTTEHGSVLVYA
ncbi:MAG: hypothetical protein ACFN1H_07530 [Propionibacterium freudenreichii]